MGRRGDRDPQLHNIAADYCVNADLKRHRIGDFITSVPCLYDSKYDGWTSEAVYDDLYEKADKIDLQSLIDQMIDDHIDGEGDGEDEDGDQKPNGKGRPRMSKEEREKLRQEVKQSIIAAAQQAGAGELPGNVARMIKEATEPQMPWRELLQTVLTSTIRNDYTFNRPNRRGWHMDAIMPGMNPGEEVDVMVFLDMSGSIGNKQAQDFLGEVGGIMEAFTSYKIHIASFDTQVYNPEIFDSESGKSITEYEPKGGGGTDFDCMFEWMKENDVQPKRMIVFTDMMPCGSWGIPDFCDTTWIGHGAHAKTVTPPFGTWAYYADSK
jgi:predicted metal-dependent peptidase